VHAAPYSQRERDAGRRQAGEFRLDVSGQDRVEVGPGVLPVIRLACLSRGPGGSYEANETGAGSSPFPVLAPYTEVSPEQVITGHRTMIRQARAAGLRIIGATLLPMQESGFSTPRSEAKRSAANAWIRDSGEYDAVIDLARAMGDALDPAHDSGDQLHPNDAGYQAMADATDLTIRRCPVRTGWVSALRRWQELAAG
jgi:hypothetical protein